MRIRKTVIILSLTANIFLAGFITRRYFKAETNKAAWNSMWDSSRSSVMRYIPVDSTSVVFVGTSITEGFPVTELYKSLNIANRGIGGTEAQHIAKRAFWLLSSKPRKMFVEMGINDLKMGKSCEFVWERYRAIADTAKLYGTQLYFTSILPTSMSHGKYNAEIRRCNEGIQQLAAELGATYVNIYPLLAKDGELDSRYTMDGLHLTGEAYMIWKSAIDTLVN